MLLSLPASAKDIDIAGVSWMPDSRHVVVCGDLLGSLPAGFSSPTRRADAFGRLLLQRRTSGIPRSPRMAVISRSLRER